MNYSPLKVVFLAHFVLICMSTLGRWTPFGYQLYNVALLICLLWSIVNHEAADPVQLSFIINLCAIIMDIFVLAFCFPYHGESRDILSVIFAILNLIVRPFSTIYLMQHVRDRTGNEALVQNMFGGAQRSSYEDIDRASGSNVRTEYARAEQI